MAKDKIEVVKIYMKDKEVIIIWWSRELAQKETQFFFTFLATETGCWCFDFKQPF